MHIIDRHIAYKAEVRTQRKWPTPGEKQEKKAPKSRKSVSIECTYLIFSHYKYEYHSTLLHPKTLNNTN